MNTMTKLGTMLLAAAAIGGLTGTAAAMPLSDIATQRSSLMQNARVVCDEAGRCYETRRHVYRDYDRDYYPRERAYGYYGAPPAYYHEGPGVGFSFGFGPRWR
jgi:hypothetical protein